MRGEVFLFDSVYFRCERPRIAVEKRVSRDIPFAGNNSGNLRQVFPKLENPRLRGYRYSVPAIRKPGNADEMTANLLVVFVLCLSEFVGYADMSVVPAVEVVHHVLENPAMCRSVVDVVEEYVVVNHFVKYDIFNLSLGEVEACRKTESEISEPGASEQRTFPSACYLCHIGPCFSGAKREHRQAAVEIEGVEIDEFLSHKVGCRYHKP